MLSDDSLVWLFNYEEAEKYEAFSQCEDKNNIIVEYLREKYIFSHKIILEIGAGSGKFTSFLAKDCNQLIAVEKNPNMSEINKKKVFGLENVKVMTCDIQDIKFAPESFDIIFAGWSMTSIRNALSTTVDRLSSWLKINGIIILIENSGNDEFCKILNIEEFTERMIDRYEALGFKKMATLNTQIILPDEKIFNNVFPEKNINLSSLVINHNVLILERRKI